MARETLNIRFQQLKIGQHHLLKIGVGGSFSKDGLINPQTFSITLFALNTSKNIRQSVKFMRIG
jgi:hypothetical protein